MGHLAALLGIGTLIRYLFKWLPSLLVHILIFFGISAVTYTGVSVFVSGVETMMMDAYMGLPQQVIFALKKLNVDKAITILVSYKIFLASIGSIRGFKNQYQIKHGGAP